MKKQTKQSISRFFSAAPHRKYWFAHYYKHYKVKDNVILLESFNGETINDSSIVFAREIERLYPGRFKVYYASNHLKEHQKLVDKEGLKVKLVDVYKPKYTKLLATAKYYITNASTTTFYTRRPEQVFLETWHGTPLKTLGKKMKKGIDSMGTGQHSFLQATHLMFPNDFTREVMMEDYNLEHLFTEKVVMSGYPRNQVFMQPEKEGEIRKEYGLEGKTVYAYLPTWRGTSAGDVNVGAYVRELKSILGRLDEAMRDDQVFYVNFHQLLKTSVDLSNYRHIREFPKEVDTYTFLNASDALVTDYSSVMFDYMLTQKPIVLFMYDYEQYMEDRGLYMDIRELPFRQIYEESDFVNVIANNECMKDGYADTEFFRDFTRYDSVNNAEKLLRLLIDGDDSGLVCEDYSKNRERDTKAFFPKDLKEESDFLTLKKVAAGDRSVVLFQRRWLKREMGQLLYEKYNDAFNYIIVNRAYPRTYLEMFLSKLNHSASLEKINERDQKRCFANLTISESVTDYGLIMEGAQLAEKAFVPIKARLGTSQEGIEVSFQTPSGYTLREAVYFDERNTLINKRPLEQKEIDQQRVLYDFKSVVEQYLLYHRRAGKIGLLCSDTNGKEQVLAFRIDDDQVQIRAGHEGEHVYSPVKKTYSLPEDYFQRKFFQTVRSVSDEVRARVRSFNMERVPTEIILLPETDVNSRKDLLVVRVCTNDTIMNYASPQGELCSYSCHGSRIMVKAKVPMVDATAITGGAMVFDSKDEELEIPMEIKKRVSGDGVYVTLSLDLKKAPQFKPLRWFCKIVFKLGEDTYFLRILNKKLRNEMRFKLAGKICHYDGMVLFPYIGKGDIIKFMYREKSEYDTRVVRAKELCALILFAILGVHLRHRKIYVIYEHFCKSAQDNSFYFFKFCMEQLPEKERKKFYYIMDDRSPDYDVVEPYRDQVIQFMSIKHMLYSMAAKLMVSADAVTHLYPWNTRPSYVYNNIHDHGVLFLQHGVTMLKRVDHLFGKKGTHPMKYFVTTSQNEHNVVVSEFGYSEVEAPILGFARWDVLENKEDRNDRFILIMPSWRNWLENDSDEEFVRSEYYTNYTGILRNSRLREFLEKEDLRVVLYLHPKFAQFIDNFKDEISERVSCVTFGEQPLNEFMMRCAMMVTDYSSVCWDVLYMEKPVVFFQFDSDTYQALHGSYIDLKTQLPSPRAETVEEVVERIINYAQRDFQIEEEYREQCKGFFEYRDDLNSRRTYEFLMYQEEGR